MSLSKSFILVDAEKNNFAELVAALYMPSIMLPVPPQTGHGPSAQFVTRTPPLPAIKLGATNNEPHLLQIAGTSSNFQIPFLNIAVY